MMRKRLLYLWGVVFFISLLAAACSSAPEPTIVPTAEAAPDSESSTAGMRTFVIDPERSSASYIVDEEFLPDALSKLGIEVGRQDTIGVTPAIEGQLELNLADLSDPLGENVFRADLSQLKSDQNRRDGWLQDRGPQFSKFPNAEFVATSVENAPESYAEGEEVTFQLAGDMTVRDVTKPATFEVTAKLEGDTLTGTAVATLLLSDFGIEPPDFANTLRVKDEFQVKVDFVAVGQ